MSALHTVTVIADYNATDTPDVRFTCTATRDDECHRESSGLIGVDECWIQAWFDNDCYVYDGSDSPCDWDSGPVTVPNITCSGPIAVRYEEDYITWNFTPESEGSES